jgi:elongation factor G
MKAVIWKDESLGAEYEDQEIPAELADQAAEYREKLIELAVEHDDDAMEAYLEGTEPDEATLNACIRKGTLEAAFVPVLLGSAFKNKGVQPLLDAIVDYLPSPEDVEDVKGVLENDEPATRRGADDEAFSALAFKIMTDPFVGSLTFARVYSGTLAASASVANPGKNNKERIGRMLLMHANHREDIKDAQCGEKHPF